MVLIGVVGSIGSGKSFTQLRAALEYCDRKNKQLVTNFPVDLSAIYEYCKLKKLDTAASLVRRGLVSWIQHPVIKDSKKNTIPCLESLLIPESVVCLDEAGIFLNSREFARTSTKLLADLCQSRKTGTDLIWAAQFDDQVDRQFRMLTQYFIHCNSLTNYDKKLKRPNLLYKRIFWFDASSYFAWTTNPKDRGSHFRARFAYAFNYEGGFLSRADRKIFDAFDSFNRLDETDSIDRIITSASCPLVRDVRCIDFPSLYTRRLLNV